MLEKQIKQQIQQGQAAEEGQSDIFERCQYGANRYPGWCNAPPHYFFYWLLSREEHEVTLSRGLTLA
ncbi:MAG: hypothetical protein HWE25_11675 [Alphaproteobacteria bacterium]|nr:hypothetical protein [Alphaproteobacteria bacterium]